MCLFFYFLTTKRRQYAVVIKVNKMERKYYAIARSNVHFSNSPSLMLRQVYISWKRKTNWFLIVPLRDNYFPKYNYYHTSPSLITSKFLFHKNFIRTGSTKYFEKNNNIIFYYSPFNFKIVDCHIGSYKII